MDPPALLPSQPAMRELLAPGDIPEWCGGRPGVFENDPRTGLNRTQYYTQLDAWIAGRAAEGFEGKDAVHPFKHSYRSQ